MKNELMIGELKYLGLKEIMSKEVWQVKSAVLFVYKIKNAYLFGHSF